MVRNKNDKINFFDSIFYNIIFYSFIFHIVFILFAKTIIDLWLGNTFSSQILVLYILDVLESEFLRFLLFQK